MKTIEFDHARRHFKLVLPWDDSRPEVEQERQDLLVAAFKAHADTLGIRRFGAPVNWRALVDAEILEDQASMFEILLALGILSFSRLGTWDIYYFGGSLNLTLSGGVHYFTRLEDVVAYAKTVLVDYEYEWQVAHVDQILTSKELLGS